MRPIASLILLVLLTSLAVCQTPTEDGGDGEEPVVTKDPAPTFSANDASVIKIQNPVWLPLIIVNLLQ